MNKPNKQTERIFVIEADGRPLVAFEAFSRREADELRKEQWFRRTPNTAVKQRGNLGRHRTVGST